MLIKETGTLDEHGDLCHGDLNQNQTQVRGEIQIWFRLNRALVRFRTGNARQDPLQILLLLNPSD